MKTKEVFIDGEKVYLKKGMFGYRVVHPVKENGKIVWQNALFGGWGNFFKLLFILLIAFSLLFGVNEMIEGCKDMAENPCDYTNLDCSIPTYTSGNIFSNITIKDGR